MITFWENKKKINKIAQVHEHAKVHDDQINLIVHQASVGTLPPFYGTCTQNKDVMTLKEYFKYNHQTKPIWQCIDVLT